MKKYLHLLSAVLLLFLLTLSLCVRADKHAGKLFSTNGPPQITVGDVSGVISACEGAASVSPAIQQFSFSASGLSADVTVTAPNYFEIARAAGGPYATSLTVPQISGLVPSTTIYIRSSAQALPGSIYDYVKLVSGTVNQKAYVTGYINPLPVIDPVADQTKQNGQLTDAIIFSGTVGSFTWTNDNPAIGLAASGTGNISPFVATNTGTTPITAHIMVTPPFHPSYIYASNATNNAVLLINTVTNVREKVISQGIPPNSSPLQMVFSPDKSLLYVCNETSKTISIIDATTNKVIASPPAGVNDPVGMVISPDGSKLYITDPVNDKMSIFNTATYAVKTVGIGDGTGSGTNDLAIAPDGKKLYLLNSKSGTLQFFNTQTNLFEPGIFISGKPSNIVISPDNKMLYISTKANRDVLVYNIATQVMYRIPAVYSSYQMAISPDGTELYVSNTDDNKVTVINALTRTVITSVDVENEPAGLTISSDGSKVYVANSASEHISVINAATNTVAGQIPVKTGVYYTALLSDNICDGQPITFSITVTPSAIIPPIDGNDAVVIPNTFSPNGDGTNDTWVIKNLGAYPQNTLEVFNRYGQRLLRSVGYGVPWDGTFKGQRVPPGTYYYILDLKNGSRPLSGSVTIIR